MKRPAFFLLIATACLALFGCDNGKVPLSGRITFDDGAPLQAGSVVFCNDSFQQARGQIDSNGRYRVGFLHDHDGMPPGNYRIYIAVIPKSSLDAEKSVEIPAKYCDPNTSGLTLTVDAGTKVHDIVLKRTVSNGE